MIQKKELWYDARDVKKEEISKILPVVLNNGYDGILISVSQADLAETWPKSTKMLLFLEKERFKDLAEIIGKYGQEREIIVVSGDEKILKDDSLAKIKKGIYTSIHDKESMDNAIKLAGEYENIIIEFGSETNIPLELVLAYSQRYKSKVCKKVTASDDGWVAGMTMEMGSYSMLLATHRVNEIIALKEKIDKLSSCPLAVEELKVKEISHVGMGDRVCIDTTSNLAADEGMLIGSTSYGGILISSETHFLPYMDLRPFRVNAGALHSYLWCSDNCTRYLSELKAGDEVLAVNSKGETRVVTVGRIKMERRPMLLIKAESSNGIEVNSIIQDDWHVRVISQNGDVKNSTKLQSGDVVLGYINSPGRHLGLKIDETIVEK